MKKGPADLRAEAEVERGTLAPTIELPIGSSYCCLVALLVFIAGFLFIHVFFGGFKVFCSVFSHIFGVK